MNALTVVGNFIKSTGAKIGFWTRKNSPELLITSGIIMAGVSVVLGIKASRKVDDILEPANKRITQIKNDMKDDDLLANGLYSVSDGRKDLAKVYAKTSGKLIRLYAPCAIAFGLSTAAIVGSHSILKGRNLALAAAYSTINAGYKNYRDRVKAKFGEEIENELYRDIREEEVEVTEKDKNGEDKIVTKKIDVPHTKPDSDWTYLFDASNPNWEKNGRLNIDWLLLTEKWLNQKFRSNGYLFLYDVYKALGIDESILGERKLQASRVVGWIYDPKDTTRDNYISFGLSDELGNLNKYAMDLVRYQEHNIWLEFNPDGDILTGNNGQKTFMKYARN